MKKIVCVALAAMLALSCAAAFADAPEYKLVCGIEENIGHQHDASCYTSWDELVCESTEEGHVHDETCYETVSFLVCGIELGRGAHSHTDECLAFSYE